MIIIYLVSWYLDGLFEHSPLYDFIAPRSCQTSKVSIVITFIHYPVSQIHQTVELIVLNFCIQMKHSSLAAQLWLFYDVYVDKNS